MTRKYELIPVGAAVVYTPKYGGHIRYQVLDDRDDCTVW
jgi:hypothetical protein